MDPYFIGKTAEELQADSSALIAELADKLGLFYQSLSKVVVGDFGSIWVRNKTIAQALERHPNNFDCLPVLETLLADHEAFNFNTLTKTWEDIDGEKAEVKVLRASLLDRWPMGTNYWVRDNALVANRLLNVELRDVELTRYYRCLGKDLLLSCLRIASSRTQLARMANIVNLTPSEELPGGPEWPHIFLHIEDNLNASKTEIWEHKQDAWQILAALAFQSLKEGHISVGELSEKMKIFLGLSPLLIKKLFDRDYESAGSWEEVLARRLSVLVWEEKVVYEYNSLADSLRTEVDRLALQYLDVHYEIDYLALHKEILNRVESRLSFEAGTYDSSDPKYREADATLYYVLQTEVLERISSMKSFGEQWVSNQEAKILDQIERLRDRPTFLIKRYIDDSYQRTSYFQPIITKRLSDYFGGVSGEASGVGDFVRRNAIVPKGREAAWVHPVFQLSAWYAENSVGVNRDRFMQNAISNFKVGIGSALGDGEYTFMQDDQGKTECRALPAFRFTECFISDQTPRGVDLIFASPHTPLHWTIAESLNAFSQLYKL